VVLKLFEIAYHLMFF